MLFSSHSKILKDYLVKQIINIEATKNFTTYWANFNGYSNCLVLKYQHPLKCPPWRTGAYILKKIEQLTTVC